MTVSQVDSSVQELRVRSEFAKGHVVRAFVREFADQAGMSADGIADLLLAVTEVFNNAVEHAHHFDASREIEVRVYRLPGAIRVDVEDQGPGFIPNTAQSTAPIDPTQRGIGLFLARHLVDELTFERGIGTIVHLTKRL